MEPVPSYSIPYGCSFDSIAALEWLSRSYRLCRIEMSLETGERTYVRLSPVHQTPTLPLEDDRTLNEDPAILQHLAAYDLCRKLSYLQGNTEFDGLNFTPILLHIECYSARGALSYLEDADATTVARALAHVTRAYGRIDKLLSDRKWLADEGSSAADAYLVGITRRGWEPGYFDLQHNPPRLHRYLEKPEQDPAVCFAHTIEDRLPAQSCEELRGEVTLTEVASRLLA